MIAPDKSAPLIERIDYFFSAPENTSAVGVFLNNEAAMFALFEKSDNPSALENYALFKRYGATVEHLLANFCASEGVTMEDVALEIFKQMELAEDGPIPYLCVTYIAGALDLDSFADLVVEINAITNYKIDDGVEPEENAD